MVHEYTNSEGNRLMGDEVQTRYDEAVKAISNADSALKNYMAVTERNQAVVNVLKNVIGALQSLLKLIGKPDSNCHKS